MTVTVESGVKMKELLIQGLASWDTAGPTLGLHIKPDVEIDSVIAFTGKSQKPNACCRVPCTPMHSNAQRALVGHLMAIRSWNSQPDDIALLQRFLADAGPITSYSAGIKTPQFKSLRHNVKLMNWDIKDRDALVAWRQPENKVLCPLRNLRKKLPLLPSPVYCSFNARS